MKISEYREATIELREFSKWSRGVRGYKPQPGPFESITNAFIKVKEQMDEIRKRHFIEEVDSIKPSSFPRRSKGRVELSISVSSYEKRGKVLVPRENELTFAYDQNTKGKIVSVILSNETGNISDELVVNHDDLESVLEFLKRAKR